MRAGEPLPATVLAALRSIVSEMRDIPRDCITDRAELLHWLRSMARRVEGIQGMRIPASAATGGQHTIRGFRPKPTSRPASKAIAARAAAEALFHTEPRG